MTAAKVAVRAPAGIGKCVEQLPELLGVDDLAAYLKVSHHFVYRLTREHKIRFVRVGKELRFQRSDVV
ncbi:MAG: helix-turn-helix domain-containing protein, partial [Acidimicrobiales bacterium]